MDLIAVLLIFFAGLLLFRSTVIKVVAALGLLVGLMVADNSFGEFTRNLAMGAYGLFTGA